MAGPAPDSLPDTSYLVLGLLSLGGEGSGYELRKWAEGMGHVHTAPAQSQIYAELRRLEGLELVAARAVPRSGRLDKRLYRLTDAGRAALRAWVEAGTGARPDLKHPVALRLLFGHVAEPARLRALLEGYLAELEEALGELAVLREGLSEEATPYPALVAEWGERRTRAERDAARGMLARLDEIAAAATPNVLEGRVPSEAALTAFAAGAREAGRALVVGALVVDDEGRLFVQKRAHDRALFPGCWDIVGGHAEDGEGVREALARELREETGWRLAELGPVVEVLDWEAAGEAKREIDLLVRVEGDLARPRLEPRKHPEARWLREDELPLLLEHRDPEDTFIHDLAARAFALLRRGGAGPFR